MGTTFRVAIIGCGNIAERHVRSYHSVPGLDIVAGVEPHPKISHAFQRTFKIPAMYNDLNQMLQAESPDVVSICTWHSLHAPQTEIAAKNGVKLILCEKPMAVSLGEADHMVDICKTQDTKLALAHQRRFYPGWTKARCLIQAGAIGQPILATGQVGDGLLNTGSHLLDGIRYVLGDPQSKWVMGSVERKTNRWEREIPIEDCCLGLVTFTEGVQALIQVDLTTQNDPDRFSIQGTEGLLMVGPDQISLIGAMGRDRNDNHVPWDFEIESSAKEAGLEGYFRVAYAAQARELKTWLEDDGTYRSEGTEARITQEIMMAIYQSARNNEMVHLPLSVRDYPLSLMIAENKFPVPYTEKYDIRGPERYTWSHRKAYDHLRTAGLSHPEIMARIFDK